MERPPREMESQLHEVHESLEDALDEVCASKPANQETTGEMIRLEENLSVAAEAAKRAVSLRRRLREEHDRSSEPASDPTGDMRPDAGSARDAGA